MDDLTVTSVHCGARIAGIAGQNEVDATQTGDCSAQTGRFLQFAFSAPAAAQLIIVGELAIEILMKTSLDASLRKTKSFAANRAEIGRCGTRINLRGGGVSPHSMALTFLVSVT